jgi:hypothetical protein
MIIGIVGLIEAGKGAVGDILIDDFDYTRISWADPLKDSVALKFGWPRELLEGDTKESRKFREKKDEYWSAHLGRDFTPRLALQIEGTEAGRNIYGEDMWVAVAAKRMERSDIESHRFVIPDTRFPNEIKYIRENRGIVVRVKRGPEPEWYRTAEIANTTTVEFLKSSMREEYPDVHYSEWAWVGSEFDATIENDGNLEELTSKIHDLMLAYQV